MSSNNIVCPVCTLFLRPGITLKSHLALHPKQKVIDALVKISENGSEGESNSKNIPFTTPQPVDNTSQINSAVVNQQTVWNNQGSSGSSDVNSMQGNHLFIYQQSMSTTAPPPQPNVLNINPLSQQYVIPTVFNPQMMPYVYQQQQVILSSNGYMPPQIRALPFAHSNQQNISAPITEIQEENDVIENRVSEIQEVVTEKEEEDPVPSTSFTDHERKIQVKENDEILPEELIINTVKDCNVFEEDAVPPQEDYDELTEENEESPSSPNSDGNWGLSISADLNKACQTQTNNVNSSEDAAQPGEDIEIQEEDQPEYYYVHPENEEVPFTTISANSNSLSEPIYTNSNILQPNNEPIDFMEMDGMHVIINDFSSNQIISQVENFDNSRPERPGVLMTIGDIGDTSKTEYNEQGTMEDSMSRESSNVNIRTDERMPPRGELSGQESIGGASDITWNRLQYNEGSSGMSASYDLLARESWEASDGSDVEMPPLQSRPLLHVSYPPNDDDTPTIVSYTGPPLNFKCSTCGEAFASSKERKEHEIENHPEKVIRNSLLGSEVIKKKRKILPKPSLSDKPETENNFDNVFTNKLKLEANELDGSDNGQPTNNLVSTVKVDDPSMPIELKTMCPICDCVLENAKALKLHKFEVHKVTADVRHKCTTCGESFPNEYKYTHHLKIHPLECRLCGKLFFRRQNIQLHMKRHLGLKPYKCETCQKSFVTKQKHDEHKNTHTGDAPIKCSMCDETFRRHSNLVQHRNRHHLNVKKKVKDYICACGEIFHSKRKLAWHKEIHESKPKSCTQCNEKFIHMSSLTRHMRRAHNEKFLPNNDRNSENVECPICKGVYLRSSLEVHIRNHSGVRPFTCLICNKDFTTKWNLKLHKWTHASRTSKPFKCDQCKGAFIRESDYTAHMNSHKSVRPYTCNYCGAQFIRKYNCQRHVKEHENGKTFNCQVCGKSFHRSYYLKDHMRVHSGIRPYACHICGKTSTTKSNHNKHVQIHHAREPVSTEN